MRDEGHAMWEWLQRGAHVYVCGDALRMAKDVERALIDIVAQHGKRSPEDAARYVNELKKADRYQADVY
jgi:sulfite reductase (NADPH) flavoprotein alpha-component